MAALVQQPNSLTNPTVFYRVVDFAEWCAFVNGRRAELAVISEHTTYGLAADAARVINDDGQQHPRQGNRVDATGGAA